LFHDFPWPEMKSTEWMTFQAWNMKNQIPLLSRFSMTGTHPEQQMVQLSAHFQFLDDLIYTKITFNNSSCMMLKFIVTDHKYFKITSFLMISLFTQEVKIWTNFSSVKMLVSMILYSQFTSILINLQDSKLNLRKKLIFT
jgi:hypothetical protein